MEHIDPQKARQERERLERERLERERKARLKREADERKRQEQLKAERDRRAKYKAEQDAAQKAQKPEPPAQKSTEPKKPVAQKPEPKTNTDNIIWGQPGKISPIYGPSSPTYSSQTFLHRNISPIAQLPETDLKPFAPLNRNARSWSGEKTEEPKSQQPIQSPKSNGLGGMCLAPGASVATFGRSKIPLTIGERIPRTFDSVDAATAYARSLGKSTTIIDEGNNTIAIYQADLKIFQSAATGGGMPLKGPMVLLDKNTDQTNVKSTNSAVQAIITQDGYQLSPGESEMRLADFAQGQDQKSIALSLQKSYASHRKAFGDGLKDIKDKDQFLKQYNLSLRDTAFHLLSASELDAKQKQQSFANGLPPTEAPKIQSVATRLEELDKQIGQAQWDRSMTDIAAGQSNQGMAVASLFSDSVKKSFEAQLNEQQAAHNRVQQLEQQRKAVLAQYPLLERVNPSDFNKLSPNEQAKVLQNACGDVLKDIATTRQNIVKGKMNLMQLAPLVAATNEGLGIQPEQAEWVAQKASSDKTWDTAGKIGLGALALGLGIAATFATGGLALALGIGAVGVGITDAALTTDEYFTNQAATNTNVDPNKSLMPQDMKGHWGWVVASWVGVGLDIGAAVKAARLLKTGMTVEEVIKATSKAHNIPEELLRGAYTASGKGTSDPKVLKNILTSALPKEIAEQSQQGLKVTVLEPMEFFERFGSASSDASTLLRQGKNGLETEVFVRKGADPVAMLEEAAHIAQSTDRTLASKMTQLSEENLANWQKLTPQKQADLYKTKLELEIDAQQRLLRQFGGGDKAYEQGINQTLDNLQTRLAEVDLSIKNPSSLKGKPWLDPAQPPRLFSKTPMSDAQLIGAVGKGYANPQHMTELLARTDLSPVQLEKARDALSVALRSGKYSPDNLQGVISKLKSAAAKNAFDETLAELSHANRLVKSGNVAEGSEVILGAKQGKEYNLGTQSIKTDPVPEADVLYLGTDGKIHLDEVKNTAGALRDKVADSEQLKRLLEWRKADPQNRSINFAVESENKWTELFAPNNGQQAVLQQLQAQNIPLSIGSRKLNPEKIGELWDATLTKSQQMQANGTWKGWKDFYGRMDTLSNTEKFLGISL
jgi:hypothetical protein